MTEKTKTTDRRDRNGWVLYDGDCPMCIQLAERFAAILHRHGFDLAPLQSPWVRSRLGGLASGPPDEMLLLSSSGDVYGGAAGIVFLVQRIWWAWPLYPITRLPGVMWLLWHLYRWVARNRACFGGRCVQPHRQSIGGRKESN